jgi:hypothetical protein
VGSNPTPSSNLIEIIMAEHWTFADPILPAGEPVKGRTFRADGWAFINHPWTKEELWDGIFGDQNQGGVLPPEHFYIMSMSRKKLGDHYVKGGVVLLSPDAVGPLVSRLRERGREDLIPNSLKN